MFPSVSTYRALLDHYLRPQRARVVWLAALLFSSIALQLLNPQIVRFFIDTTQQRGEQALLLLAAGAFLLIGLLQRAMALASVYVGENTGWAATNALRADLTRHCLGLDMPFHKRHTPGELIERLDGDVTALANFFAQFTIHLLGNGLLVLAVLALLFREDWRVGAGLAVYVLLTVFGLGVLQRRAVARWSDERQASADMYAFLEEHMNGTEDIRANGAEAHILDRLLRLTDTLLRKTRAAQMVSNITFMTTSGLYAVGYALGLAVGAYLYSRGAISIGTAYVIVFYIGMLAAPLEGIRAQVEDVQQASASIARVSALFGEQSRIAERPRAALPGGPLDVSFEGVMFRYDDEGQGSGVGEQEAVVNRQSPALSSILSLSKGAVEGAIVNRQSSIVLQDVSFALAAGQVLGLLGRTGSGKTTLTRLLFRLYDPTGGAVRLGGADLRDVALADVRARVGVVTQDVQLFAASVRDNLTFFDRSIDDARIWAALDELGLRAWAGRLPDGLDTQLQSGGAGLSAGEAQLLAFARVFLKNPSLVILDEASSRLDPATEQLLEQAIERLLRGRTGIIIAHRLRTVQRADMILILEHGQIAEYGLRAALATDAHSRFAELLRTGMEEVLA